MVSVHFSIDLRGRPRRRGTSSSPNRDAVCSTQAANLRLSESEGKRKKELTPFSPVKGVLDGCSGMSSERRAFLWPATTHTRFEQRTAVAAMAQQQRRVDGSGQREAASGRVSHVAGWDRLAQRAAVAALSAPGQRLSRPQERRRKSSLFLFPFLGTFRVRHASNTHDHCRTHGQAR